MRILMLFLFLVAYVGYLWLIVVTLKRNIRALQANRVFWSAQVQALLGVIPLFVFVYLLSGYFSWRVVGLLLLASQVGIVFAMVAHEFGAVNSRWGARTLWAGGEFALKHKWIMLAGMFASLLLCLAYPVVATISYFLLPIPELPTRMFQYTLALVVGGYVLMLYQTVGTLASENLDEDTRSRLLYSQLGGVAPNALWLAILFWSLGLAGTGKSGRVGGIELRFSPLLVGTLIGLFALTVVLPYVIGARRAKAWRADLMDSEREWIKKMAEVLEKPPASTYVQRLEVLQNSLAIATGEFVTSDPMIGYGERIDRGDNVPEVGEIDEAYRIARNQDPRFRHLDWLRATSQRIDEIRTHLTGLGTGGELARGAREWRQYLASQQHDLAKESSQLKKGRTFALLASAVVVPIASPLLSEFAKWIWAHFSHSIPAGS